MNSNPFSGLLSYGITVAVGAFLGAILIGYGAAGLIYEYEDTMPEEVARAGWKGELPDVDVIVCLAGGRSRIRVAGDLWRNYAVRRLRPTLYVAGTGAKADWDLVQSRMNDDVLELLKREDVFIENVSTDTIENAQIFAKEAKQKGWRRLLLVTSSYHMRRSQYVFGKELAKVLKGDNMSYVVETYTVYQEPFRAEKWKSEFIGIRVTIIEFLKWVYFLAF